MDLERLKWVTNWALEQARADAKVLKVSLVHSKPYLEAFSARVDLETGGWCEMKGIAPEGWLLVAISGEQFPHVARWMGADDVWEGQFGEALSGVTHYMRLPKLPEKPN